MSCLLVLLLLVAACSAQSISRFAVDATSERDASIGNAGTLDWNVEVNGGNASATCGPDLPWVTCGATTPGSAAVCKLLVVDFRLPNVPANATIVSFTLRLWVKTEQANVDHALPSFVQLNVSSIPPFSGLQDAPVEDEVLDVAQLTYTSFSSFAPPVAAFNTGPVRARIHFAAVASSSTTTRPTLTISCIQLAIGFTLPTTGGPATTTAATVVVAPTTNAPSTTRTATTQPRPSTGGPATASQPTTESPTASTAAATTTASAAANSSSPAASSSPAPPPNNILAPAPSGGLEGWAWALIGITGLCCIICVLYFVGVASLPKPGEEERQLEALITELESKHPDVDFNQVRSEIYQQVPDIKKEQYAALSAVEAQRLVDEAIKLHDADDKRTNRMSVFNPPFRGLFRRPPPAPVPRPGAPAGQYGFVPSSPRAVLSGQAPSLAALSRTDSQYGVLPDRQPGGGPKQAADTPYSNFPQGVPQPAGTYGTLSMS